MYTYKNKILLYFLNVVNSVCHGWTSAAAEEKVTLKGNQTEKNQFGYSELPGSLEDSNDDYFSNNKR